MSRTESPRVSHHCDGRYRFTEAEQKTAEQVSEFFKRLTDVEIDTASVVSEAAADYLQIMLSQADAGDMALLHRLLGRILARKGLGRHAGTERQSVVLDEAEQHLNKGGHTVAAMLQQKEQVGLWSVIEGECKRV